MRQLLDAERTRGLDELALLQAEHLAAHDAGHAHPPEA